MGWNGSSLLSHHGLGHCSWPDWSQPAPAWWGGNSEPWGILATGAIAELCGAWAGCSLGAPRCGRLAEEVLTLITPRA